MQIIYSEKYMEMRIPVDYCNLGLMKKLCEIIVYGTGCEEWVLKGLYLNRTLDDEDVLSAKSRLEKLFYKKLKKMNVAEEKHFLADSIVLTTNELSEYFGDFAVYYMEIVVKPKNQTFVFPKMETEADANYLYVKMDNKNKVCINKLLKCIGVDKLKKIEYENSDCIWNENLFYRLKTKFSEIDDYMKYKTEVLKKYGLMKRNEGIKLQRWKRKIQLIFYISNKSGEQSEIVLLEITSKHKTNRLQILFLG